MRHELLAEVWRSGFLESVHHGSVIALHDDHVELRIGEPEVPIFPRSCNKPLQALAMLRHGLDLEDELLALACASHSGEGFHIAGVRRILASARLHVGMLQCTPGLPLGDAALRACLAAGGTATPLYMNCSGKHAAMLATCVANGWPTDSYREPDHPLQEAIEDTVADLAGEPVAAVGIDGCGAPVLGISLVGLARAFARLAAAAPGTLERKVADAMVTYPEYVGGAGRDVTTLMRAVPGLVAKDGAEAVFAVGLPDGHGVAVKIADGNSRARPVVMAAALRRIGVEIPSELMTAPVLGHGEPVGSIRPAAVLAAPQPVLG
ncbi:MAG TPA: asparaginase [Micromonosporaceae bacterium]